MRDFVQRIVEKLNVDEGNDRVAVVQYSREPEAQFYLITHSRKDEVRDAIRNLRHKGGRPLNTGAALQFVRDNVFTCFLWEQARGRCSSDPDCVERGKVQRQCRYAGFGFEGPRGLDLWNWNEKLRRQGTAEDFIRAHSEHLAVCNGSKLMIPVFSCEFFAVDRGIPRRDVVFLLDGSDGTSSGFPAMRDFAQRIVEKLNVDEGNDRVAVVQYSREPEAQFYLNTHSRREAVRDAIRTLRHKGGRPLNTGAALQFVRDNVFTASSGSRRVEGVPQILVLLNGGRSNDNVDTPASALKGLGILTIGIGTRNSDTRELQKISHDPNYALSVPEFSDLPNIQQQLVSSMSTILAKATPITPTVKDVVFLLDGSDGTRSGFPAMRDFVQRIVEKLNVDEGNDRVAVVQYSREPEAQFYLITHSRKDEVRDAIRTLRHKGGRPLNTGAALQFVRDNVFTASSGSRRVEGVPQILIVLSGGRSNDNVDTPASALRDLGVLTFGIGTRNSDARELQKISYEPSYAQSVSEFSDLPSIEQQLVSSVDVVVTRVSPEPPTVIGTAKDVVFLLDGSDGTRSGFPAMRDFVQRIVEKLKYEALDDIRTLRHKGGRPLNTGAALQFVRDNVFTASSGSRRLEGVPQILVLLNGGRSNDNVDTPASALKGLGILTIGIGTRNSDTRELQKISHDPNYALSVPEFSDLPNIQQQLVSSMSTILAKATPITPTVVGKNKDVVFLLDGSDGTRSGFPAMRDFVQRIVEKLNVDEGNDRVAVVQYSREPEAQFYLITHSRKDEVRDAIRNLRHKGGRPLNTGAALQFVRDNVFTASSGSRRVEGVPQILIVLSGGRSNDNVDTPASALRDLGVLTFGIGTRNSDARELQKISYEPSYAQSVSEFSDLPSIEQHTILAKATPITPTVVGKNAMCAKDVVFLLDGSDGTRSGFPAMRDFVQRIVEKLNVDEGNDRVAVVQYSREPEAQFYLITHSRKDEVRDAIRNLRHKGGRPLNTGAALQFVRDNVFTASSGSRRVEGVPQILIVLSGGRSNDNVDTPASALRDLGVLTFGIGTRNSDARELQKISYEPSYAQSVSEFSDLPSIEQQLVSSVDVVVTRVSPEPPTVIGTAKLFSTPCRVIKRDVVFLLDGSDGTSSGFAAMRDFAQRIVEKLSVDEGKDRVAVVQYSREPEAQFYLNTHSRKDEALDDIRTLRHKGGRPLNTGAALQFVRDNVFTASSGSRRLEGVPQILVLLNGGRSNDNVDTPASALKGLGILTIGIGTRNSDTRELQKISHDPNYALSVPEFSDLPNIQQQLVSSMSTILAKATPITPTVVGKNAMCAAKFSL
uniref:VWFA domain-containing protein n=1 Tax=Scleropages formosus TaxID=113540 RepID=A0A8C9RCL4_SCLFO